MAILGAALWLFQRPVGEFIDRMRLAEVEVAPAVLRNPSASAVSGAAANGYIVARTRAALSADTPGRLVEINVTEGSLVAEGDVVARLYFDEYEAALARAEADLELARAGLPRARAEEEAAAADLVGRRGESAATRASVDEAAADLELARANHERTRQLFVEGHVTQSQLDERVSALAGAGARLEAAQARLATAVANAEQGESRVLVAAAAVAECEARIDLARATRDQARATLEKTFVRAPFSGVVVQKEAEVGEVVSPNSQGGSLARGSVVTMVDLASLEVQADVPETSLAAVKVGAPAHIYLDAWPQQPYGGRIDRIWPTADRQKATVEVRVAFDGLDGRLRPDMGVRVVFLEDEDEAGAQAAAVPVVMVDARSLVREGEATGVFVVDRGTARWREIAAGAERMGRVVVEAGLEGGERVVLDPPASLGDADRIRVKEDPQ
ncbi:MAG: efflux RND transporter periplasmic adaptor subunit [Planctomycetota bacterium]|nr:efflux RND transporter periplasmic adaptor subunit [Planctomycetota bacterium]MDP6763973.1 efflux RND transporter periplasmic adaptor subunit [Planctomycetota bacterium]MDP6988499.1 efflux RND transporter periplasmic adaptor subunit [Planctomycetota bacterium]